MLNLIKTDINSSKSKPVGSNPKHMCRTNETSVPFLANPGRSISQDEKQSCLTPQHSLNLLSTRTVGDCVFLTKCMQFWKMVPQELDRETVFCLPNMHLILKSDANPQCLAMSMIDEQKQNLFLWLVKSEYNSIFQHY